MQRQLFLQREWNHFPNSSPLRKIENVKIVSNIHAAHRFVTDFLIIASMNFIVLSHKKSSFSPSRSNNQYK